MATRNTGTIGNLTFEVVRKEDVPARTRRTSGASEWASFVETLNGLPTGEGVRLRVAGEAQKNSIGQSIRAAVRSHGNGMRVSLPTNRTGEVNEDGEEIIEIYVVKIEDAEEVAAS